MPFGLAHPVPVLLKFTVTWPFAFPYIDFLSILYTMQIESHRNSRRVGTLSWTDLASIHMLRTRRSQSPYPWKTSALFWWEGPPQKHRQCQSWTGSRPTDDSEGSASHSLHPQGVSVLCVLTSLEFCHTKYTCLAGVSLPSLQLHAILHPFTPFFQGPAGRHDSLPPAVGISESASAPRTAPTVYSLNGLGAHSQKGPVWFCCRQIEMFHNFLTRGSTFSFALSPHKLCGWSCLGD